MLSKVMKYDLKRLGKTLIPLYVITLIMGFVNYGFQILGEKNFIFSIPAGFILMAFIVLLIGTILGTFVITIKYFCTNLLSDEGYLTNTLPVTKNVLISSKVLTAAIYQLISLVVFFFALWIGALNSFNLIDILVKIYDSGIFKIMTGLSNMNGLILFIVLMAISYLVQWLFFIFAIALGQTRSGNRVLYSFVYGALLYCVQQVISFVMMGALVIVDPQFFTTSTPTATAMLMLYIMSIIVNVVLIIIYWVGSIKVFEKKLNLE